MKTVDWQTTQVDTLPVSTFKGCNVLETVILTNSIEIISQEAFSGCAKLTTFTLQSQVSTIGQKAFTGSGLTEIEIPSTLTTFTLQSKVTTIGQKAFTSSGLINIEIPSTVTTIQTKAFSDCKSLSTITYPCKLENFENDIFEGCSTTSLTIKGSTEMQSYTMTKCPWYELRSSLTTVTFDTGVTSVGSYSFYRCNALVDINWEMMC